ncbi:MAG: fructose-bisphosphate aldolase class I [Porphyrobacter sp.]|nr:fructose-bisphosphate aldolase class I [Porphyrobacter sp.]
MAPGKGILAAGETPGTLTKRFEALGIHSTPDTRRAYREMLFGAYGASEFISGVILQDETIRQQASGGLPFARMLTELGILPGIKVDAGAKPLAGSPGETVTEGLDGLRERLAEYRKMGARFTKWRAVLRIDGDRLPTRACIHANSHALARYAALAQEADMVPIVEPEVLMEGAHDLARSDEVTSEVLQEVFRELFVEDVQLECLLLKPSMVIPGSRSSEKASQLEVAAATLRCLLRHVPAAVPGVVFLSGGQSPELATAHLDTINRLQWPAPWTVSFSYGRALQDPALERWGGHKDRAEAGAQALIHRARCNSAAALGAYSPAMEEGQDGIRMPNAAQPATLDH